jgi:hypothetical protein
LRFVRILGRDLLRKGLLPNPPPNLFVKDPLPPPIFMGDGRGFSAKRF